MAKISGFSSRLAEAIAVSGKKKLQVARAIGITALSLSRYLAGTRIPHDSMIKLFARELRVSEEWLRSGIGARARDHGPPIAIDPPTSVGQTFRPYGVDFLSKLNSLGDTERVALEQFLRGLTGQDPAIRQHLIGQMRIIDRALGPPRAEPGEGEEAQHG